MKKFIKPSLAEYGKAIDTIKGQCSWGSENWKLDRTGSVERNVRTWVRYQGVNWDRYVCEYRTRCNGSHDC